ncbi:MAG: co-chaperone GroES [Anaerolineaceae bacterium]|nr:co-chaperone GroES [Anaerolineaceae bacterium]
MSKLKIQPLGIRVVIKPLEQEAKTASGLYIPESAKEKPQTGVVVAVGGDEEITLKVDDVVIYAKYTGTEVKLEGEDYLIMEYGDVLAKMLS